MRLSAATLPALSAEVARPGYDRDAQGLGIVHLGLGAFSRAHAAVYADDAMAGGDRDWAVAGVSMRSPDVRDALAPQDGLYTVTEEDGARARRRLVGAVRELVVAPREPARVAALLAMPTVHVATITVTEKAYRPPADGAGDALYRHLARGLAARRVAGLPGLTLVSCDNLSGNGAVLAAELLVRLDRADPGLRRWFEAECACPVTMVDRIVPAADAAAPAEAEAATGLRDEGALLTEPFRQWVIQDRFAGPRPRWELGGAMVVADVAPYEAAKLRMLNGAHSALAYLGLAAGHEYVHQAVADPAILATVDGLMRREAAPSVAPAPGQDLDGYADALLSRFRNPALRHRLAQIAADGSQKIPPRWLEPLAINAAAGRRCPATLRALAGWIVHLRDGRASDPLAAEVARRWQEAGRGGIVESLFAATGPLVGRWAPDAENQRALVGEIDALIPGSRI